MAWRRARTDRAQATAEAEVGMLLKGKELPTTDVYDKPMAERPDMAAEGPGVYAAE
jgi:hypothetical protein|eukprot:COSAG01_NODE_3070_length_6638_cov_14.873528_4_plen_56_part_00